MNYEVELCEGELCGVYHGIGLCSYESEIYCGTVRVMTADYEGGLRVHEVNHDHE